ncbi:response regulator [Halobacteriovorax marinus]|uniref:Chemotaxis protein n=1 Tax=Halobacteriovorax marinus (strain ATCC BAA-682 / DSM 15412 / SJ) TaxID=862908 RepID=E1WY66_HALMS|nr:response regulator [Halobacteriovorax marinus]ATH08912.1 response regulator [Halobacteriovorax marinus]CBW27621.1 putative chemotaxis protein [Halobacteriovorax marinus SJ]
MKKKKFSVLVIDDEEKICKIIKIFLDMSSRFSNVVLAKDALEGMMKLNNQEFDLIIVDKSMPNRTGLEFIENLKKSFKLGKVKVLLISGCLTKEETLFAMKLGVKNILVKPFNRQKLMEKIGTILDI